MYSVSANFKTKIDDPQTIEQRRFTFDGTDYSTKLIEMGGFQLVVREGEAPPAADLTVTVLNDAEEWDFLRTTKTNIGKTGKLEIGIDGEYISRFAGKLERVELVTEERPKARLVFVGRIQQTLDRTIGSSATPVNYTSAAWNPADLAWDILTVHAGLDATASTANVDIDYTNWLDFKSKCADLGFVLKAQFTGQSVAEGLRLIGELTDSLIFGETDGKVHFRKYLPEEATPYLFSDAVADFQRAQVYFDRRRIINRAEVYHGYTPGAGTWAGSVTKENTTSQTNYGLYRAVFDSANAWHSTSASAGNFGERLVDRYTEPTETIQFNVKRGTQAPIHQLGDAILVTWGHLNYSSKLMRIYGMQAQDLTNGLYQIEAEDLATLNKNFFILDSATNGVLDSNVLY